MSDSEKGIKISDLGFNINSAPLFKWMRIPDNFRMVVIGVSEGGKSVFSYEGIGHFQRRKRIPKMNIYPRKRWAAFTDQYGDNVNELSRRMSNTFVHEKYDPKQLLSAMDQIALHAHTEGKKYRVSLFFDDVPFSKGGKDDVLGQLAAAGRHIALSWIMTAKRIPAEVPVDIRNNVTHVVIFKNSPPVYKWIFNNLIQFEASESKHIAKLTSLLQNEYVCLVVEMKTDRCWRHKADYHKVVHNSKFKVEDQRMTKFHDKYFDEDYKGRMLKERVQQRVFK